MNNKVKITIGAAALMLLLIFASIGYNQLSKNNAPQQSSSPSSAQSAAPTQSAVRPAPNFTVQDMSGNTVAFSDFKGKPVVINFWASWCPPCKAEMPDYEKMYQEYASKGVVFLMIDLVDGSRETVPIAKQFLKDNKYTFTAYFDVKGSAANAYRISSIPDSIFIDKNGNIVNNYVGMINSATMKKNIEAILAS
jgi:thiol-disulfide isomerase/thioredoxin